MTGFRPHPLLRRRVASIDVVEAQGGETVVLPSTSAVLGFQYRGRVRAGDTLLSPVGVTGIQTTARTYAYEPDTGSILVRFTPTGASCLGPPGADIAGRSVSLDAVLPAGRVTEVHERLCEAPDADARVAIVQDFLMGLPYAGDALVAHAVAMLERRTLGVAAVSRALGVSERQLERRFRARVGVTPKVFSSLVRFQRAVAYAAAAPSLGAAALEAGYYDQSHFIREFRRFAGTPPGDVLRLTR